ncbi:MAG: WD40 repeat domain-containing protein, partial [Gemmataceae bacterium]|nr:WD40 repeat domain-containing protein [Gemmataceae bacterium]
AEGAGQIDLARVFPDADNPKRWTVKWRQKNVRSVVFRPDGRFLVCLLNLPDRGEVMVLLDGSTGEIRRELPPLLPMGERAFHPAKPQYVSFRTQDDRHFLVLVDTDSAAVLREQPIPFEPAVAAWHPDGKRLAVAGMDRSIRLLDDRLQVTATIPEQLSGSGIQLAYSPMGDFLVSYDWSRELRIFDGSCGDLLLTTSMALADHRLTVSPDHILTPELDGKTLRRYRLMNRSVRPLTISPHTLDAFCKTVWSHDRQLLVTSHGSEYQTCLFHAAASGAVLAELPPFHVPLWFEADDSALITAVDHDHQTQQSVVYRWPIDRKNGVLGPPERLLHQNRIGHPAAAAQSPIVCFGPIVYRRGMKGAPVILDISKQGWPDIRHASLSPDGRWAVLSSHGQGNSCLYDLETMAWTAELLSEPGHSVFSPDGSMAAVFGERSGRLYRTADWQVIGELPGSTGAFSLDGRLLAVSGATRGLPVGTVELIDTETAHTICRFEHPSGGRVDPLGFGPDPAQLYLRVWRTRTIDVWDLREARRQLRADLDLDWDWPEFPTRNEPPGEPRPWTVKTDATGTGLPGLIPAAIPGAMPATGPANWRRWVETMLQKFSRPRRPDP